MSDLIQLLPDHIANQIAAGEVIQRPASVVKELIENAIDAGADTIQLLVKDAGKTLIQISDNGKGMTKNDAIRCFERHATSKLKTAEDLLSRFGAPFALVLAHGVMSEKMSKTLRTTEAEWRRVMAINLDSVFTLVNVLGGPMAEARDGRRVVIFSACLGRMSGPGNAGGLAPYRISKAGVNAFVRNLAHETGLGARGFYVDAICPNHSRTDMGGADAPRSAEEGAECAVWLATREFNTGDTTGVLWEDRQIVEW